MNFEIERKFLIKYPNEELLKTIPRSNKTEIFQTYLLYKGGNLRVRKRGVGKTFTYTKTLKKDVSPLTREEYEDEITCQEYENLLKQANPAYKTLHKYRWAVPFGAFIYEIDLYPFWTDLAIMEVEIESENTIITEPPFVHIIRDVTLDRRYSNKNMANIHFNSFFYKEDSK